MGDLLQTGLFLMLVGMATVFAVLGIVVLTGRTLIRVVNGRAARAPATTSAKPVFAAGQSRVAVPSSHIAAITAAVHVVTGGKGYAANIEISGQKHE